MLELCGYVVKTKAFGRLTCYYLIGNTVYCINTEGAFKSRSEKGFIDLSVDSHSFQPLRSESQWPIPIYNQIHDVNFCEGLRMFGIKAKDRLTIEEFFDCMVGMLIRRLRQEIGQSDIEEHWRSTTLGSITYEFNKELSRIQEEYVDIARQREVVKLSDEDRALICGLIETSCGKSKLHQSFSALGLDLKLISDPDNVTGALRFEGGVTLEEAFLNRNQD